MKIFAIIVAAGTAQRMGKNKNKILLELAGEKIINRTWQAILSDLRIDKVFTVCSENDRIELTRLISLQNNERLDECLIIGGASRQESVRNAINFISKKISDGLISSPDFLLIHDGARCLLSRELLAATIDQAVKSGCATAPALPIKDTVYMIDQKNSITRTVDRNLLRAIQTPQIFKFTTIQSLYESVVDLAKFTDDISMALAKKIPVDILDGEEINLKITTPADLVIAEAFAKLINN